MKSALLFLNLVLAFFLPLNAREIEGIAFPEKVSLDGRVLVLNGTAVRTLYGFRVYAVGLYLSGTTADGGVIMEHNADPKRLRIVVLRSIPGHKFASAVHENIAQNFTHQEQKKFASELDIFFKAFKNGASLESGSEVRIDYLPGKGTLIEVDRRNIATIPGREFYHTLLRLWIGKPLQASIKTGLLSDGG